MSLYDYVKAQTETGARDHAQNPEVPRLTMCGKRAFVPGGEFSPTNQWSCGSCVRRIRARDTLAKEAQ